MARRKYTIYFRADKNNAPKIIVSSSVYLLKFNQSANIILIMEQADKIILEILVGF